MKHKSKTRARKSLANFPIVVALIILGCLCASEGCSLDEKITTYLCADSEGNVDESRLHTVASSKIVVAPIELIISFRRVDKNSEVYDMQILVGSKSAKSIQIDRVSIVSLNRQRLSEPIVLRLQRNIAVDASSTTRIANFVLDLTESHNPEYLDVQVELEWISDQGEVLRSDTFSFVRAEVSIPVSYR